MMGLTETGGIALVTAFLSSVAIVLVAIIGRRQTAVHTQAVKDRKLLHENTQNIKDAIKPGNGDETIGQGVEGIAVTTLEMKKQLDGVIRRLSEGDARFERIEDLFSERGARIDKMDERSAETLAMVGDNHAMFKNYIEAWTPLAARAVGEWGVDGLKDSTVTVAVEKKKGGRDGRSRR
jgi:hypothetical protein